MPSPYSLKERKEIRHGDEMQDIIKAVPSWLLRWGITLFFAILLLLFAFLALIRYPDIISTGLKISSPNGDQPIIAKSSGRLIKLLVLENQPVHSKQPLAYIENLADHAEVLQLLKDLNSLREQLLQDKATGTAIIQPNLHLGELQLPYQTFTQAFFTYQSSKPRTFNSKVTFLQALNSLISQAEEWKDRFVISASQNGKVYYAGSVQQNQLLKMGQEVFFINPGNEKFYGEVAIPQQSMAKVKVGQEVLIRLRGYPSAEYGMIRGRISYIAAVPYRDSIFLSRVDFNSKGAAGLKKSVVLKQGMLADAEIITQNRTILQRIMKNVIQATDGK